MKNRVKYPVYATIAVASLAATCVEAARAPAHARVVQAGSQCRTYATLSPISGQLAAQQEIEVRQWATGCTGALMISTSGGQLHLDQLVLGGWREVRTGISINLTGLRPGTFRLRLKNVFNFNVPYNARLMFGTG